MFWKFRVLLFYATVSCYSIIHFFIFYILVKVLNVNYSLKYKMGALFSYGFIWLAKSMCGLKYNVSGLEKLPSEPSIVLSNHQSFWDNIFMQLIIPEHSWIIKQELFNIPFFGWGLKMLDPIAVDRQDNISVKQILRSGQKKLKNNLWLIIFPESTRLMPEQVTKFKPSAIKLASMAKVPIVLIAHNSGIYWPKGFWIKKPGTIQVKIIKAISAAEVNNIEVRELTDQIEQIINSEKQRLLEQTK